MQAIFQSIRYLVQHDEKEYYIAAQWYHQTCSSEVFSETLPIETQPWEKKSGSHS